MTPEAPHSVGNVPCAVCQGDHRDPKDKIIADLLAALRALWEYRGYAADLRPAKVDLQVREAIAAAEAAL